MHSFLAQSNWTDLGEFVELIFLNEDAQTIWQTTHFIRDIVKTRTQRELYSTETEKL